MKTTQNCGKCGLCLTVCPVYKELKEEQASPRARLQLIKSFEKQDIASSPHLKQIITKCLMCGSCAAMCPSGIDHYSKFMDMRKKMVQDHGETPAIKSLIWLLAKEYRLSIAGKVARAGQNLIPAIFKEKYQLGNIALQHFPEFNRIPFRDSLPEVVEPAGTAVGKVVYFTGCATNYLFDDTGYSAVNILKKMGYKVIIPKNQTCCSIPMLFHGASDGATHNIVTNIKTLASEPDVDAIIVDCATCGTALKKEYPSFVTNIACSKKSVDKTNTTVKNKSDGSNNNSINNDIIKMANQISLKTTDLLSFIEQRIDLLIPLLAANRSRIKDSKVSTVTYHAPCHLKNSHTGFSHVERLLEALPSVKYNKATDVDQCCGGGGTFFYEYPEISRKMVEKKIVNAEKTGSDLWLTDCPVCRINLAGNAGTISRHGDIKKDKMPLIHPIFLINSLI